MAKDFKFDIIEALDSLNNIPDNVLEQVTNGLEYAFDSQYNNPFVGANKYERKLFNSSLNLQQKMQYVQMNGLQKQLNLDGFKSGKYSLADGDSGTVIDNGFGEKKKVRLADLNRIDSVDYYNAVKKSPYKLANQPEYVAEMLGKPQQLLTPNDYARVEQYHRIANSHYLNTGETLPFDPLHDYSLDKIEPVDVMYKTVGYDRKNNRELVEMVNPRTQRQVSFDISNNPYLNANFDILNSINTARNQKRLDEYQARKSPEQIMRSVRELLDDDGRIGEDIDLAQAAFMRSYAGLMEKLPFTDQTYWKKLATDKGADEWAGVKESTRQDYNKNMAEVYNHVANGNYKKALYQLMSQLDRLAMESVPQTAEMFGTAAITGGVGAGLSALGWAKKGLTAAKWFKGLQTLSGAGVAAGDELINSMKDFKENNGRDMTGKEMLGNYLFNVAALVPDFWLKKFGLSSLVNSFAKPAKFKSGAIVRAGKELATGMLGEAAQEGFQQLGNTYMTQDQNNKKTLTEIATSPDIQIASMAGGLLGGVFHAPNFAVSPILAGKEFKRKKEVKKVQEKMSSQNVLGEEVEQKAQVDFEQRIDSVFKDKPAEKKSISELVDDYNNMHNIAYEDLNASETVRNKAIQKQGEILASVVMRAKDEKEALDFLKDLGLTKEEAVKELVLGSSRRSLFSLLEGEGREKTEEFSEKEKAELESLLAKLGLLPHEVKKAFEDVTHDISVGPYSIKSYSSYLKKIVEKLNNPDISDEDKIKLEKQKHGLVGNLGRLAASQLNKVTEFTRALDAIAGGKTDKYHVTWENPELGHGGFDILASDIASNPYDFGTGAHGMFQDFIRQAKSIQEKLKSIVGEEEATAILGNEHPIFQRIDKMEKLYKDAALDIYLKMHNETKNKHGIQQNLVQAEGFSNTSFVNGLRKYANPKTSENTKAELYNELTSLELSTLQQMLRFINGETVSKALRDEQLEKLDKRFKDRQELADTLQKIVDAKTTTQTALDERDEADKKLYSRVQDFFAKYKDVDKYLSKFSDEYFQKYYTELGNIADDSISLRNRDDYKDIENKFKDMLGKAKKEAERRASEAAGSVGKTKEQTKLTEKEERLLERAGKIVHAYLAEDKKSFSDELIGKRQKKYIKQGRTMLGNFIDAFFNKPGYKSKIHQAMELHNKFSEFLGEKLIYNFSDTAADNTTNVEIKPNLFKAMKNKLFRVIKVISKNSEATEEEKRKAWSNFYVFGLQRIKSFKDAFIAEYNKLINEGTLRKDGKPYEQADKDYPVRIINRAIGFLERTVGKAMEMIKPYYDEQDNKILVDKVHEEEHIGKLKYTLTVLENVAKDLKLFKIFNRELNLFRNAWYLINKEVKARDGAQSPETKDGQPSGSTNAAGTGSAESATNTDTNTSDTTKEGKDKNKKDEKPSVNKKIVSKTEKLVATLKKGKDSKANFEKLLNSSLFDKEDKSKVDIALIKSLSIDTALDLQSIINRYFLMTYKNFKDQYSTYDSYLVPLTIAVNSHVNKNITDNELQRMANEDIQYARDFEKNVVNNNESKDKDKKVIDNNDNQSGTGGSGTLPASKPASKQKTNTQYGIPFIETPERLKAIQDIINSGESPMSLIMGFGIEDKLAGNKPPEGYSDFLGEGVQPGDGSPDPYEGSEEGTDGEPPYTGDDGYFGDDFNPDDGGQYGPTNAGGSPVRVTSEDFVKFMAQKEAANKQESNTTERTRFGLSVDEQEVMRNKLEQIVNDVTNSTQNTYESQDDGSASETLKALVGNSKNGTVNSEYAAVKSLFEYNKSVIANSMMVKQNGEDILYTGSGMMKTVMKTIAHLFHAKESNQNLFSRNGENSKATAEWLDKQMEFLDPIRFRANKVESWVKQAHEYEDLKFSFSDYYFGKKLPMRNGKAMDGDFLNPTALWIQAPHLAMLYDIFEKKTNGGFITTEFKFKPYAILAAYYAMQDYISKTDLKSLQYPMSTKEVQNLFGLSDEDTKDYHVINVYKNIMSQYGSPAAKTVRQLGVAFLQICGLSKNNAKDAIEGGYERAVEGIGRFILQMMERYGWIEINTFEPAKFAAMIRLAEEREALKKELEDKGMSKQSIAKALIEYDKNVKNKKIVSDEQSREIEKLFTSSSVLMIKPVLDREGRAKSRATVIDSYDGKRPAGKKNAPRQGGIKQRYGFKTSDDKAPTLATSNPNKGKTARKVRRSDANIPETNREAMKRLEENKHIINGFVINALKESFKDKDGNFDIGQLYMRLGAKTVSQLAKMAKDQAQSQVGQNRSIISEVDYLFAMYEKQEKMQNELNAAAEESGTEAERAGFFFKTFFSQNGRIFYDSSTLNPQTGKKLCRFACLPEQIESEWDIENPEHQFLEQYAIAQAFDFLKSEKASKELFEYLYNGKTVEQLTEEMHRFIREGVDFLKTDKFDIGEENFGQIIVVFQHLILRKQAESEGKTKIKTWLSCEQDSTTSGYYIRNAQFPIPSLSEEGEYGSPNGKVGINPNSEKYRNLSTYELKKSEGFLDVYKTTAYMASKHLAATLETKSEAFSKSKLDREYLYTLFNTLYDALPKVGEDGKVSTALRNLCKPPTMVFGYNAGDVSTKHDVASTIIEDFVSKYMDLYAEYDSNDKRSAIDQYIAHHKLNLKDKSVIQSLKELDSIRKTFEEIYKTYSNSGKPPLHILLKQKSMSEIWINVKKNDGKASKRTFDVILQEILVPTYGNAIWSSLSHIYGEQREYASLMNEVASNCSRIHMILCERAIKKHIEEHKNDILTIGEIRDIIKQYDWCIPGHATLFNPMYDDDGNLQGCVNLTRTEIARGENYRYNHTIIPINVRYIKETKELKELCSLLNAKLSPEQKEQLFGKPNGSLLQAFREIKNNKTLKYSHKIADMTELFKRCGADEKHVGDILAKASEYKTRLGHGYGAVRKFKEAIGNTGGVNPIHFDDGMIMTCMILNNPYIIPVHDATVVSALHSQSVGQMYNAISFLVQKKHNMFGEVVQHFQMVKEKIDEIVKREPSLAKTFEKCIAPFGGENKRFETLDELLAAVISANIENQKNRLAFFSTAKAIANFDGFRSVFLYNPKDTLSSYIVKIASEDPDTQKTFKKFLGSNPKGFKTNGEQAKMLANGIDDPKQRVKILQDVNELSKSLGNIVESDERVKYLSEIVGILDVKPLKDFVVKYVTDADFNAGIMKPSEKLIKIGFSRKNKNNLNNLSVRSLLSPVEITAHEYIHAGTRFAIANAEIFHVTNEVKQILHILEKAIPHLNEDIFMPDVYDTRYEDIVREESKEMLEYIVNNRETGLDEFVSFGLTHQKMIDLLKSIKMTDEKRQETSLFFKLVNLFKSIWDVITMKKTFSNAFKDTGDVLTGRLSRKHMNTLYDELVRLTTELSRANRKAVSRFDSHPMKVVENAFGMFWDIFTKGNKWLADKLQYYTSYAENSGKTPEFNIPVIPDAFKKVKSLMRGGLYYCCSSTARKYLNHMLAEMFHLSQQGMIMSVIRDFSPQDDQTYILNNLTSHTRIVEQAAKNEEATIKKTIYDSFKRTLTDMETTALHDSILKTDLQCLYKNGMSLDDIKDLLKDRKKLTQEIHNYEKKVKDISGTNTMMYNLLVNKCMFLAYYMVDGKGCPATNINSTMIIRNVGYLTGLEPSQEVEEVVDNLTTLYALYMTDKTSNAVVSRLENEGLETFIKSHKAFVDSSYGEMTLYDQEGNAKTYPAMKVHQIQKGFVKQSFDPSNDICISFTSHEHELANDGYKRVYTFKNLIENFPEISVYRKPFANLYHRDGTSFMSRGQYALTESINNSALRLAKDINPSADETTIENTFKMYKKRLDAKHFEIASEMSKRVLSFDDVAKHSSGYIPVYNANHQIVDYTLSMSEKDRRELLGAETDGVDILAKMYSNKYTTIKSSEINNVIKKFLANDMAKNMDQKTKTLKGDYIKYVKIEPETSNKFLRDAYSHIPVNIRKYAEKHDLYIREDWLSNLFGNETLSADETRIAKHLPGIVRAGIRIAEYTLKIIATIVKSNILLKVPAVLVGNIVSNICYSVLNGENPIKVISKTFENTVATKDYLETRRELNGILFKERIGTATKEEISKKATLQARLDKNIVAPLISKGMFQVVIEDQNIKDIESVSKLAKLLKANPIVKATPDKVKGLVKYLYMTEGTPIFDLMNQATQFSDFASRCTHYQLKMESAPPKRIKMKNPNGKMETIDNPDYIKYERELTHEVWDAFINYEVPQNSFIQYLNDLGLAMFTKYFLRIQRVLISNALLKNPLGSIMFILFNSYVCDFDNILHQNVFDKEISSLFHNPVDNIMEALVPMPFQYLTGMREFRLI